MKTLYLPEVINVNELFASMVPWDFNVSHAPIAEIKHGREKMVVSTFCRIVGRGEGNSFKRVCVSAVPSDTLLAWIRENVMFINRDSLSFEILVGADGNCLVVLSHGQIIGDYWLTESLRVETLPEWVQRGGE